MTDEYLPPPPTPPGEPVRIKTMRTGPRLAAQLPAYPEPTRHTEAVAAFFDAEGKPLVASAREIAPPGDNPLWWPLRFGAWLAYWTVRGRAVWPLNVRSNALLFYLVGRVRPSIPEDALAMSPWLVVAAADGWGLWQLWKSGGGLTGWFSMMALSFALVPAAAVLSSATAVLRHVARVEGFVPFEELMLTRMTADETIYGLMIRPFGLAHLVNAAWGMIVLPAATLAVVWALVIDSLEAGSLFRGAPMIAIVALGLFLTRGAFGMLCINVASAVCMRERMLTPRFREGAVRAAKQCAKLVLAVAICEGIVVLLATAGAWFVSCLGVPVALYYASKYLGGMNAKAGALLADTAESWRKWHRVAEDRESGRVEAPGPLAWQRLKIRSEKSR